MVASGSANEQRCTSCDRVVEASATVCPGCGEPTTAPERKLVTLLFADLTGYTELCSRLDPEEVHHFVRPAMTELRRVVESYGGSVPQVLGDGFMAVFGAPTAHEDDAERAVRAGLELIERVTALGAQERGVPLPPLHVGNNTGEVLVAGSREASGFSVAGDPVNVASRLCGLATGGQILVGERTRELTGDAIEYGRRRSRRVKGLPGPLPMWEPHAVRHARRRRPSSQEAPFQGRAELLARLDRGLEAAIQTGVAHVLLVSGDAGLGKSRLAREFAARTPDALVLTGGCSAYGEQPPLSALTECVAGLAGLYLPAAEADVTEALASLAATARLGDRAAAVVRRLAELMGVPAAGRRGGPEGALGDLAAMRVLFEGLARSRPLVLVLDDLHWADAALRQALAAVRDDPWSGAILLLGLTRPEGELGALLPAVPLPTLERDELLAIVAAVSGGQPPAWLADVFVARSGGNPLFLEECVRMLVENGGLLVGGDGWLRADDSQLRQVPHTMRQFITARLDALPIAEKALLQDASVSGDGVWDGLLERLAPGDDTTAGLLVRLEERGLLARRPVSRVPGNVEYDFKHVLIRDVAYEVLPRRARAARHRAVADWMREVYAANGLRAPAGVLAHHYRQSWLLSRSPVSGPPGCEVARLAVTHLAEWGRESLRLQARVAERAFDQALEIATEAERCFDRPARAALYTDRAAARNELGRFTAAIEDAEVAERLLPADGEVRLRATATLHRARSLSDLARMDEAREACDLALALYADAADKTGQAEALYQAARNWRYDDMTRMNDGLREAYHACREAGARAQQADVSRDLAYTNTLEGGPKFARWYAEAQRLTDEDTDLRGRASLRRTAAFRAWYAGDRERALTLARDAAADAADAGARWVEADALHCQLAVLTALGRLDESERLLAATLELADRMSGRRLAGMAYLRGGPAAQRRRAATEAADRLREARERLLPLGSILDLTTADAVEAAMWLDAGRWPEVREPAQRLVDVCEEHGWSLYALRSRIDVGRAALALGADDAVGVLATAVDEARRQEAPRYGGLAAACLEQAQLLAGERGPSRIGGVSGELTETRATARENEGLRAWRSGDAAAAAAVFGAAAAEWAGLGATVWLARALVWRAVAARRTGDADGAAEMLAPVPGLLTDLDAPAGLVDAFEAALA